MKQSGKFFVPIFIVSAFFILFSLACASDPEPESSSSNTNDTKSVTIEIMNDWLVNHEEEIKTNKNITQNQLIEITKRCIDNGKILNTTINEQDSALGYALLSAHTKVWSHQITVDYSYSISNSGVLTMRIIRINGNDFIEEVTASQYKNVKESLINRCISAMTDAAWVAINSAPNLE